MDLQPGQTIGPYQIISQIGLGGMATVYKAYHAAMDRYVAIKVLPRQLADSPEFMGRFQQEARTIANLEHAHILPVYDYGESEGIPYLVMRFLEVGTLKDRLTSGPLSLPEIDRLFTQLAEAIGYAHARGVIHRDLKPSNVLLDAQGSVFLSDFGIAKLLESSRQFTSTGGLIGTPDYMSPEQAQGLPVDARTDIYSLGIILYEMVTGRVPFEAETPLAVVLKQINAPLPLPSTVKPDISPGIEQVLLKALAKNPADRFASASDFIAAWKQALSGADTLRSQAEGSTPAATVVVTPARPTQPELSPGIKPDSTRGLSRDVLLVGGLLGGLAICLCLAIGLGLGAFSSLGGIFRPSASGAGQAATSTPEAVSTAGEVRTEIPGEATAPTTASGTPADRFTIAIGDEVLESAPGQGAGDIENPGGQDIYTFTADPGQTVYFQINQTTNPQIKWQAVDEVGSVLFDTCLGCGDPGVKVLEHGGAYTLIVGTEAATETGAYHFKVWNVAPPDQFEIAIGAEASQDALGPGAGNIENPGVKDIYTFTATPGQTVYFQVTRPPSGSDLIKWRLMDETDSVIFDTCLQCGDPGVKVLEHGGTYSVMVGNDSGAATGTYDFKIWDVPPPDQFTVVVGDEVSKETGQGAGYIETPGVKDIYSFTATPGQTVYFQITQPPSGSDLIKWRLMDETEAVLFDTCLQCGDPGTQTLERGGTYTIIVGNDTGPATGTYQFKVWEVPPPDQFAITIGDEIAKDSPGQGAGDIESPGAKDIYTFTATPGQQVDFRVTQPPGTSALLKWRVVDELNNVVFDTCLQCGNPGVTTLERGGTYTIVVGNDSGAATGSYGFLIAAP